MLTADIVDRQECVEAVERRWRSGNGATAGDLGVLVMHELALTYAPAERELRAVLEDWELRLYEGDRTPEELTDQREALRRLWRLRAVLRDWVAPLNRPGMSLDIDKVWLPASDHAEAIKVDDRVDRVLENLATLGEALRSSFHLVHLEEAERERDRREQVQRQVELVAAIFIVPTFIFGLYGANTWLPGQGSRLGFAIMCDRGRGRHRWAASCCCSAGSATAGLGPSGVLIGVCPARTASGWVGVSASLLRDVCPAFRGGRNLSRCS